MKLANRESELAYLKETKVLAAKKLFTISISGIRRVGKTRLILEFLQQRDLYFFVNKDKSSESLLAEYAESLRKAGLLTELEALNDWEGFFKILFGRYRGVVAFDEFQNFIFVERSIFGILQKYIDLNEGKKNLMLIFSGSIVGLIKKMFSDSKEPLYGRLKRQLQLKPLSFSAVYKMCSGLDISNASDVIRLYAFFGGFPRYYVAIEDENLEGQSFENILERFFLVENAIFENEIPVILALEFGKRSGVYYDILAAIANGCTRISEIASFLRKKETAISRQLSELIYHFDIVGVEKQLIGKKKLLFIRHPLIDFWFKFFYKNLSSYQRREAWLVNKIKKECNDYIGKRFEWVCSEFLAQLNIKGKLPFKYEKAGRQWGKIPHVQKDRNQYEIDIAAINESTKEILFAECKWRDKVDAAAILAELKAKAQAINWNNDKRKEYYAVFAKSFKTTVKSFEGAQAYCFDLRDIERLMRK